MSKFYALVSAACWINAVINGIASDHVLCFHGIPIVLFQFLAGAPSGFVPDRSRPSEDLRAYHISEHANVTLQPYYIEIS
jgi:hypothetical protein